MYDSERHKLELIGGSTGRLNYSVGACKSMRFRIAIFVALLPSITLAIESGDKCTATTKLPNHMLCWDDSVLDCNENHGRAESLVCASEERQTVDKKLNQTYHRMVGRLTGKNRTSLIEAQRAWVKFKVADCEDEAGHEETVANWKDVAFVWCETELTRQRLQTLERRYGAK